MVLKKVNLDTTPNQVTGATSSLMIQPHSLSRLSACEVVKTFDFKSLNLRMSAGGMKEG